MPYIIAGVALITAIILFAYLRIIKGELAKLAARLEFIAGTDTNMQLYTGMNMEELNKLVRQTNDIISEYKSKKITGKRIELEFKQAVTDLSHDLRTPLTSASGYLQMIKSDKTPPNKKAEYIDIVQNRLESLRKMLDALFEYSRLQSGEYVLEMQKLDVCAVLSDLASMYYNDFKTKGIVPEIKMEHENFFVNTDKNALRRIFENLFSNALKHGGKGIAISVFSDGEFVNTSFRNRAENLTPEDASHMFDRFFTADKSRSTGSTGLGLAIAKELAEKTGGRIESELKDGILVITVRYRLIP